MLQSEAKHVGLVVETVLWEAVPQFLRKLNETMKDSLHQNTQKPAFVQKICGPIPWFFKNFYVLFSYFKVMLVRQLFFFTT
jgi:hypothetical protein